MLPLVERTAGALAAWLGAAWGGGLSLKPDLDQVPALSADREALWSQLEKASFLTRDEKRAAVGYGPLGDGEGGGEGGGAAVKYSPDQPRDEIGRWTNGAGTGGSSGNAEHTRLAQLEGPRQYSVDLDEEETLGGHTQRNHVGKSDDELLRTLGAARIKTPFVTIAKKALGSFASRESANDFVNRVLEEHQPTVDLVASGTQAEAWLEKRFGSPTGKEAFRPGADADPYLRATFSVGVFIRHDRRSKRGYRVHSAYPLNEERQRK